MSGGSHAEAGGDGAAERLGVGLAVLRWNPGETQTRKPGCFLEASIPWTSGFGLLLMSPNLGSVPPHCLRWASRHTHLNFCNQPLRVEGGESTL